MRLVWLLCQLVQGVLWAVGCLLTSLLHVSMWFATGAEGGFGFGFQMGKTSGE